MSAYTDKAQRKLEPAAAGEGRGSAVTMDPSVALREGRAEAAALRSTFAMASNIPRVQPVRALQRVVDASPRLGPFAGLKSAADVFSASRIHPIQLNGLEKLMMESGVLADLQPKMQGQMELWPDLAQQLTAYSELHPDEIVGGLLDCGKLTVPFGAAKFRQEDFEPGPAKISPDLRLALGQFLLAFMEANGQLAYIRQRGWFKRKEWRVVIEVNFYPDRDFKVEDVGLGMHKDTDSRNIFVNLIFNNATDMPATEWTLDSSVPDKIRMKELELLLPKKELRKILRLKEKLRSKKIKNQGRDAIVGGISKPNTYVSWSDELVWHSTPSVKNRGTFGKEFLLAFLDKTYDKKDEKAYLNYFYEAMLILAEHNKSLYHGNEWLGDLERGVRLAAVLRDSTEEGWVKDRKIIREEIERIDWSAHKVSGRVGRVEIFQGPKESPGRSVPTDLGGRPRANSDADVQKELMAAIKLMKEHAAAKKKEAALPSKEADAGADKSASANELPKRSFIRTWVTVVRNDKT